MAHSLQRVAIALPLLAAAIAAQQSTTGGRANSPPKLKAFSHKTHLKLGNIAPVIADAIDRGTYLSPPGDIRRFLNTGNACEACHRGMAESSRVTAANMPQMADCLVCHTKIDPPESCAFCHTPGPRLRPASHTADFLDTHTSKKLGVGQPGLEKQTCAVCHGRKFTCLGCH